MTHVRISDASLTDDEFLIRADSRVAYAVEEERQCGAHRLGQIQQHESGADQADSRVTVDAEMIKWNFLYEIENEVLIFKRCSPSGSSKKARRE